MGLFYPLLPWAKFLYLDPHPIEGEQRRPGGYGGTSATCRKKTRAVRLARHLRGGGESREPIRFPTKINL